MSNALPPFSAKLLSSRPLGGGMRELCLEVPDEFCRASRPGMFVHLKVPDAPQHLLRRPISIMDLEPEDNLLVLGVQPKGEGTRLICSLREGGCIEMLGPLGNGFSLNDAKTVWAIGGGVGVAPMLYACREFSKSARVTASLGFRTRDMIFSERDFHESAFRLVIATDDGPAGFHGNALAALSSHPLPDLIIACGPTPMLKAVQEFALGHNLHCQLSLEQRMGCGYGACLTCSCRTMSRDGEEHYARVCADGPVFDAGKVVL